MTNDEVHSRIYLDPVTSALLSTPPMQRLRGLQQLGTAQHVYINANHSRFEHSLGVAHLAEKLCQGIQKGQPQLPCTDKDVLCVKLAGLMHDLGHGPFSHVFEDFARNDLPAYLNDHPHLQDRYKDLPESSPGWDHEKVSLMMVDAALEYLGLRINLHDLDAPLEQVGFASSHILNTSFRVFDTTLSDQDAVLTSRDWVFIKECILGEPIPEIQTATGIRTGFVGRPHPHKEWLYDIVCNQHSGLDVDKIDYFARDKRRCKRDSGEIFMLPIDEAFVTWAHCPQPHSCHRCAHDRAHLMICYPEKMVPCALDFFRLRHTLHDEIYQHKGVTAAAYMVKDILCRADPFFMVSAKPCPYPNTLLPNNSSSSNNNSILCRPKREYTALPLSRAAMDPHCVLRMEDSLLWEIGHSTEPELVEARQLWGRFKCRDFYKCVGKLSLDMEYPRDQVLWNTSVEAMKQSFLRLNREYAVENGDVVRMEPGDVIIEKQTIHYGRKRDNPIQDMRFLPKYAMSQLALSIDDLPHAVPCSELATQAGHWPRTFENNAIRVFSTHPAKHAFIQHMFEQWRQMVADRTEYAMTVVNPARYDAPMMLSQESEDGPLSDVDDEEEVVEDYYCMAQSDNTTQVTPTRPRSSGHL
jgi:deoxynucleoside triphosphate triphosphohydrolase SAMHD1